MRTAPRFRTGLVILGIGLMVGSLGIFYLLYGLSFAGGWVAKYEYLYPRLAVAALILFILGGGLVAAAIGKGGKG